VVSATDPHGRNLGFLDPIKTITSLKLGFLEHDAVKFSRKLTRFRVDIRDGVSPFHWNGGAFLPNYSSQKTITSILRAKAA
jgi:hypothetical protein